MNPFKFLPSVQTSPAPRIAGRHIPNPMKPIVYRRVTPNFTIRLEMPPWMPYWFLFILAIMILCLFILAIMILCLFDYATR